jgi:hypothetical protein
LRFPARAFLGNILDKQFLFACVRVPSYSTRRVVAPSLAVGPVGLRLQVWTKQRASWVALRRRQPRRPPRPLTPRRQ